jgi:outer membrane protein OmpA-like peptidoglycan-associated protein
MNILSLIQSQLSPQTLEQISNAVGESPEGTKSALGTAFPALLGSLLGKANSSPSGVTDIFNMLKQGQGQGWSDSMGNVLGSLTGGAPQATHQSLLSSLLGSKLGPVSDFIASRAGIRGSSATSLLSMAAPLLMGTLGKQVSSQGLGAAGLGQLLSAQIPYLKDMLPAGLANTLGIGNLLSAAPSTEMPAGAKPAETYQESYTRPSEPATAGSGSGILKWAWVPLLLALAGWFVANRMHRTSEMGGTSETAGNTVATGRAYQTPNFANLNLTPGGIADNLAKAISKGDWSKTIELQGFTADTADTLSDSAKSSVREIASVLTTAPNVKVKITGRGDTEEAGSSRANAIKSALTSAGVAENRISTVGQAGEGAPTISLMR